MVQTKIDINKYHGDWRWRNHEWQLESEKKSRENFKRNHPEFTRTHSKEWAKANASKLATELYARRNVPIGTECEFCGDTKNLVRHHPDYTYRTIIVTCCQSCHKFLHYNPIGEVKA